MPTTIPVEKVPEATEDELNTLAVQLTGAVLDIDAKVATLQSERSSKRKELISVQGKITSIQMRKRVDAERDSRGASAGRP